MPDGPRPGMRQCVGSASVARAAGAALCWSARVGSIEAVVGQRVHPPVQFRPAAGYDLIEFLVHAVAGTRGDREGVERRTGAALEVCGDEAGRVEVDLAAVPGGEVNTAPDPRGVLLAWYADGYRRDSEEGFGRRAETVVAHPVHLGQRFVAEFVVSETRHVNYPNLTQHWLYDHVS